MGRAPRAAAPGWWAGRSSAAALDRGVDLQLRVDDAAGLRAAEDDEVDRVLHVQRDAPLVGAVDAAVDEVTAGGELVVEGGGDEHPLTGAQLSRLLALAHWDPEVEDAEAVGVGDEEADVDARQVALDLELQPQPDLLAVLEVGGRLAVGPLEPRLDEPHVLALGRALLG